MINVNNVTKSFNKKVAVNIPYLEIKKGEIIGLVGNNGAGKTTFFRLLLDLIKADSGYINSNGIDVAKTEDWKVYTGSFIDNSFLIEFLTPEEYFTFIGKLFQLKGSELNERLSLFEKFMNGEILNQKKYIRNFSAGNKQKIGIIGAMMINPKVLILDEPFNFLDPSSQAEIKKLMQTMNSNYGTTTLISSHNLNHITDLSTRVLLMEKGSIIKDIPNKNGEAFTELESYFEV